LPSSYLIFLAGAALEILLLCRLARANLWREYSCFSLYVLYATGQSVAVFSLLRFAPDAYATWYWRSGAVHLCLRFLLIWEIFRHIFPKASPLRQIVSREFTVIGLGMTTVLAGIFWGVQTYGKSHSAYLAMDRSFGLIQAVLTLAILIVARYYQVQLGRNIWGIAVAFGMYSSLSTVNSACTDLFYSYFPYSRILGPVGFVAMLTMWIWAVWVYAPNQVATADQMIDPADDLRRWSENWGRAVSTVRKVMHP
jgi:hypothetical protein